MAWKQALDRAHSLAQLDAIDTASVLDQFAAEIPAALSLPELEARDAELSAALDAIDALAIRAMKIRLDHALASDSSIGPPTRNVFAQTIVSYADNIALLAERTRDLAARGRAPNPDEVADRVAGAARASLDLRATLRAGVLDLIRRIAKTDAVVAERHARDPKLDEASRKRWSAIRRDHEALAMDPAAITAARMAKRVAAWPDLLEEPEPVPEATLAELIEID